MMHYGLTRPDQVIQIASDVCDVLGHGKNGKAFNLLVETACQETWLGQYKDRTPHVAGVGVCQFDQIGVDDVIMNTRAQKVEQVIAEFGIDIRTIELRDLANSPLVSFIFCRLKYMRLAAPIPDTLEGRAEYWKVHYNSKLGKGTPEEYVNNYRRHGRKFIEGF